MTKNAQSRSQTAVPKEKQTAPRNSKSTTFTTGGSKVILNFKGNGRIKRYGKIPHKYTEQSLFERPLLAGYRGSEISKYIIRLWTCKNKSEEKVSDSTLPLCSEVMRVLLKRAPSKTFKTDLKSQANFLQYFCLYSNTSLSIC